MQNEQFDELIQHVPQGYIDFLLSSPSTLLKYAIDSGLFDKEIAEIMDENGLDPMDKEVLFRNHSNIFVTFLETNTKAILNCMGAEYLQAVSPEQKKKDLERFKSLTVEMKALADYITSALEDNLTINQEFMSACVFLDSKLDEFTQLVDLFYRWPFAKWGSYNSRAGALVRHDVVKPISMLANSIRIFFQNGFNLEDFTGEFSLYHEVFAFKENLQELISYAQVIIKQGENDIESNHNQFYFSEFQNTLVSKFAGENPPILNLIVNGEPKKDYAFVRFEVWMSLHTYILNSLFHRAQVVTIEVIEEDPKFFIVKVIDDIKNRETDDYTWGAYVAKFMSAYELGKSRPDLPKIDIERGGETSAYFLGQLHTQSGSTEELIHYENNEKSKWITIKFPKAA